MPQIAARSGCCTSPHAALSAAAMKCAGTGASCSSIAQHRDRTTLQVCVTGMPSPPPTGRQTSAVSCSYIRDAAPEAG